MAWRCTGRSNGELIENMSTNRIISSDAVAAVRNRLSLNNYQRRRNSSLVRQVFKKVDRANYVLDKSDAYIDSPQSV